MKRRFIVTADDFGVTPLIDIAITNAVRQGIVTSVACFPNGTDAAGNLSMQAVKDLKNEFPGVEIGCHFTITSGQRCGTAAHGLCSNKNDLKFRTNTSQHPDRVSVKQLTEELQAQLSRFTDAGLEVTHFSDHMGFLSYTQQGMQAIVNVINDYARSVNRNVPMRNPLLVSCIPSLDSTCLGNSALEKKAGLGLVLKNTMLGAANLFRNTSWQKFKMNSRKLGQQLQLLIDNDIPVADYFIDTFYASASHETLKCIQRNIPGTRPDKNKPIHPDIVAAELMVHLAIEPGTFFDLQTYESEIAKVKEHRGISVSYLRGKRVTEYSKLMSYFKRSFPTSEHGGFVMDGVNVV